MLLSKKKQTGHTDFITDTHLTKRHLNVNMAFLCIIKQKSCKENVN